MEFNKRFNKVLNRIPQDIRSVDSFLIFFYQSAFESKTHYEIRSHRPSTLQESFKVVIRIENDRKVASKFGKRDESRLFDPKYPKQNKDEDKIDKLLSMIKDLHRKYNINEGC